MRLKLNGQPELQLPDRRLTKVRSDRVWAMLGYLALRRSEWVSRAEVSLALWPDAEVEVGRHRLRQTLQYCKALSSVSLIEATTHTLRLSASVVADVFDEGPSGDFLDGLRDEWIAEVRVGASSSDGWIALVEGPDDTPQIPSYWISTR